MYFSGFRYFSKIIAVDSAGFKSDVAVSDGVVVDNTPPQPMITSYVGINLLQNPSFEIVNESFQNENVNVSASSEPKMESELKQSPFLFWNLSSTVNAEIVEVGADVAKDGVMVARVFGSISQTFSTVPGQAYQISFYVSHTHASNSYLLNQEGHIQAPGLSEVFKLYNRPAHGHSSNEPQVTWLRHTFYFTAFSNESTVTISSLGRSNGILLDNAKVLFSFV